MKKQIAECPVVRPVHAHGAHPAIAPMRAHTEFLDCSRPADGCQLPGISVDFMSLTKGVSKIRFVVSSCNRGVGGLIPSLSSMECAATATRRLSLSRIA